MGQLELRVKTTFCYLTSYKVSNFRVSLELIYRGLHHKFTQSQKNAMRTQISKLVPLIFSFNNPMTN